MKIKNQKDLMRKKYKADRKIKKYIYFGADHRKCNVRPTYFDVESEWEGRYLFYSTTAWGCVTKSF